MSFSTNNFLFDAVFRTPSLDAFAVEDPTLLNPQKLGGENLNSPVILSVPHGGNFYPAKMVEYADLKEMRTLEDVGSDIIIFPLIDLEQCAIIANCSRAIIDVNRPETALDPKLLSNADNRNEPIPKNRWQRYINSGYGVTPRLSSRRNPLYKKALPMSAIQERINYWHKPYHQLISQTVSQAQKLFTKTLLLDIHSMPQSSPKLPDIVIGNFNGLSASMEFTNLIIKVINQFGFTFSINTPYAGGFITEYHGKPNENRHAVQIEINRDLYLKENYTISSEAVSKLTDFIEKIIKSVTLIC